MTQPEPAITIDVDVANPGQFYACCGLLELASRLDAEALGWFGQGTFCLTAQEPSILQAIVDCEFSSRPLTEQEYPARFPSNSKLKTTNTINPIEIGSPFDLKVDWWLDPFPLSEFKTWSGDKMVPIDILQAIQEELRNRVRSDLTHTLYDLWDLQVPLSRSPFFLTIERQHHPVDIGFSIDKRVARVAHRPLRELTAFIALQRFRPVARNGWHSYAAWTIPLPIAVASGAATARGPCFGPRYEFQIIDRDTYGHRQLSYSRRSDHG